MIYQAQVSGFVLDKYEATVGRFRKFVEGDGGRGLGTQQSPPEAGSGAHPRLVGSGWDSAWNGELAADKAALKMQVKCSSTRQTWTDEAGGNENKAMNCVTWYEAMAFCIWDGGYLPTEAEWHYAASGGSEHRAYPWSTNPASSTTINCTHANYYDGTMYCVNPSNGGPSTA
jgi:formylglycine-generating enzyme required for sulfatase activity